MTAYSKSPCPLWQGLIFLSGYRLVQTAQKLFFNLCNLSFRFSSLFPLYRRKENRNESKRKRKRKQAETETKANRRKRKHNSKQETEAKASGIGSKRKQAEAETSGSGNGKAHGWRREQETSRDPHLAWTVSPEKRY